MANLCSFSMMVRGNKLNIEEFYNALCQNGNSFMGRGAECDINYDGEENMALIDGCCKWSIQSALIDNAISMRIKSEMGLFDNNNPNREFITLIEASERWELDVEVFSEETGCCFQEHYLIRKGEVEIQDVVDYYEYWLDEFETKEEAEDDLQIKITDEEWEDKDCISRGGIEWDFQI